jgi:hypothetical protein
MADQRKMKLRVTAVATMLDKAKGPLLSDIAGSLFPRFFDFSDEELDAKIAEIDSKEELESGDILELAACYYIMFLKMELEGEDAD